MEQRTQPFDTQDVKHFAASSCLSDCQHDAKIGRESYRALQHAALSQHSLRLKARRPVETQDATELYLKIYIFF